MAPLVTLTEHQSKYPWIVNLVPGLHVPCFARGPPDRVRHSRFVRARTSKLAKNWPSTIQELRNTPSSTSEMI